MTDTALPEWWPVPLHDALTHAETAGATGTARFVATGLLELTGHPRRLAEAVTILLERLPSDAPLWHIARASRSEDPAASLFRIRADLDKAAPQSVAAAAQWVIQHGGKAAAVPSSSLVAEVLSLLGAEATHDDPVVGLAGADAIGPKEVLNIIGTNELTRRLPTLVVTTSLKLVPGPVFARLGAPVFERIPLEAFAGIVVDGEIIDPMVAGRRAAAIGA